MAAQFPGAVKTFTTKNAGDTVQPVDINDLQDEINAIEDGYLNGHAGLNSSRSTLATLSVTGASTLTGTVQVGGNSTFAGAVQIAGNCTVVGTLTVGGLTFSSVVTADAQPRCRLFHSSTQTSTNNEENILTFNSEDYDVGGLHSTAVNPTRITIQSTGLWMFGAVCNIAANNGPNYIRFRKNGATAMGSAAGHNAGSIGPRIHHTVIEQLTSTGDYVEVLVFHNDGFTMQTGNASSRVDQNEFWAVKLW